MLEPDGDKGMSAARSNQEWILSLSNPNAQQAEVIAELGQLLLRAALYTLVTHLEDLQKLEEHERVALAEDCAQEALLSVLAHLDEFRGESKFTTWAYKFGVNTALTRARHERWKQVSLDELSENGDSADWLEWGEGFQTTDSEQPALRSEVRNVIEEVFRCELTDRQRQVLKWVAFDGVPMDVVVERLASNRNAIYKLLHDARLKVKRHLADQGYELEEVTALFQ